VPVGPDRDEPDGGLAGFEVVGEHVPDLPAQPGAPARVQVVPVDGQPLRGEGVRVGATGHRGRWPGVRDRQVDDGVGELGGELVVAKRHRQQVDGVGRYLLELHPVEGVRPAPPGVPGTGVADVLAAQRAEQAPADGLGGPGERGPERADQLRREHRQVRLGVPGGVADGARPERAGTQD
jgi:hypothetical protein